MGKNKRKNISDLLFASLLYGVIAVVAAAVVVDVRVPCVDLWYRMNTTRVGGGVIVVFYRNDILLWEGYPNTIV